MADFDNINIDDLNSNEEDDSELGGWLDNMGKESEDEEENEKPESDADETKKRGIKLAVIAIVAIIVVVFVFVGISGAIKRGKNKAAVDSVASQSEQVTQYQQKQVATQSNAQTQQGNTQTVKKNVDTDGWKELTSKADVAFNSETKELMFTVTEIHHYARQSSNSILSIKTVLKGSLAGMSGTYELEVPYDKGTKLQVGSEFTVNVQIGSYNEKTVVGEISYK